jgi:hypothetical protein
MRGKRRCRCSKEGAHFDTKEREKNNLEQSLVVIG